MAHHPAPDHAADQDFAGQPNVPQRCILIVEDEEPIASAVAARLRSEGFRVEIALDGPSAVERCANQPPDLVVLDLMLPGLDGLEVCRRIQRDAPIPVLMLTARDSETDVLVGLAVGADDYLTKPFSPRELVARIHALLRRDERAAQRRADGAKTARSDADDDGVDPIDRVVHRIGDLTIDVLAREVHLGSELIHLTPIEFDLLTFLAGRPRVVFTREQLLARVWGYRDGSGARTVDSHVQAIRRKVGSHSIRTVHGVGYAIGAPS